MSHSVVDKADSVRSGEELNIEVVDAWLKSSISEPESNTKIALEGTLSRNPVFRGRLKLDLLPRL